MPRQIALEVYQGPWEPHDKDANLKDEVSHYSRIDPMPTLDRMSQNMGIPVGSLVRYILVKWATSGSEGLLEMGPRVVHQMADIVTQAEAAGTDQARLEAYQSLTKVLSWLKVPLDDPRWRPGERGAE